MDDKGRSVGPRSARAGNTLHVDKKPRKLALQEKSPAFGGQAPGEEPPAGRISLPGAPLPSTPWTQGPAQSSIPEASRGVWGPPIPQASLPEPRGLDTDTASGRVPGLSGRKQEAGFKPSNNSVHCRHRE